MCKKNVVMQAKNAYKAACEKFDVTMLENQADEFLKKGFGTYLNGLVLTACKGMCKDKVALRSANRTTFKLLKVEGITFEPQDVMLSVIYKRASDALKFQ